MGLADELFDLTGRVALVTGGSRGLGRQMALALAGCGADVVVASRDLAACQAVAGEIEAATGRAALPYAVHAGRWEHLDGLVDAAYERFGQVDVLVNNAGMSPTYDSLGEVTERLFDVVLNLNLKGPFRLSALIGERMVVAGRGSIINVSSTGSVRPSAAIAPYAAAKAGLNSLTDSFALALGPTVRVNTLMAGPFASDAHSEWARHTATGDGIFPSHALQRAGAPREIVGAAVFLASDASSYTTGATLRVDGGIP
jgi:NAD(P)-dependent dehydrogenase (short-subunit alcohol dehydrogenase family)